jgi:hypothetical protein
MRQGEFIVETAKASSKLTVCSQATIGEDRESSEAHHDQA